MVKINYLSDLHLEFYKKNFDFNKLFNFSSNFEERDIICLCGDIGYPEMQNYSDFIDFCSKYFKYVFVISGNHEYYSIHNNTKTIQNTNELIENICSKYPNVHFLNNKTIYLEEFDIHIIGSTLWVEIDENFDMKQSPSNDFKNIYYEYDSINYKLNQDFMDLMYYESVEFLEGELNKLKDSNSKIIVLTHHLPSFQLIGQKFKNNPTNFLYASNLDHFFDKFKIDYWICGHSHSPNNIKLGGSTLLLNPIGYPGELLKPKFNEYFNL